MIGLIDIIDFMDFIDFIDFIGFIALIGLPWREDLFLENSRKVRMLQSFIAPQYGQRPLCLMGLPQLPQMKTVRLRQWR